MLFPRQLLHSCLGNIKLPKYMGRKFRIFPLIISEALLRAHLILTNNYAIMVLGVIQQIWMTSPLTSGTYHLWRRKTTQHLNILSCYFCHFCTDQVVIPSFSFDSALSPSLWQQAHGLKNSRPSGACLIGRLLLWKSLSDHCEPQQKTITYNTMTALTYWVCVTIWSRLRVTLLANESH